MPAEAATRVRYWPRKGNGWHFGELVSTEIDRKQQITVIRPLVPGRNAIRVPMVDVEAIKEA
jgi:hypothetical protein